MDFPQYEKNKQTATQEVDIEPPAFDPNDSRSADERWLDQQWRDADKVGLGKSHPLSLNRDHANIGNARDPYTT